VAPYGRKVDCSVPGAIRRVGPAVQLTMTFPILSAMGSSQGQSRGR
jgi:hypothetical protein